MTVVDYPLILLAAAGLIGFGKIFMSGAFWRPLLGGMLFAGLVTSLLAWVAPAFIAPTYRVVAAVGLIHLLWLAYRGRPWSRFEIRPQRLAMIVATAGVYALLFHEFSFLAYGFSMNDTIYLGPIVEFYLADYSGILRIPTYYPAETSAIQVLPFASLGAFLAFLPEVDLVALTEARYLFAVAAMTYVTVRIADHLDVGIPMVLLFAVIVTYLFVSDYASNFTTSAFLYAVVVAEIFIAALCEKEVGHDLLILTACLAPLQFILVVSAFVLFVYLYSVQKEVRFSPVLWVFLVLIVLNVLAISGQPKPYDDFRNADMSLSLVNPFGTKGSFDYRGLLARESRLLDFGAVAFSKAGIAATALLFLVKYYLVTVWATLRLSARGLVKGDPEIFRGIQLYVLASLLGALVVRNSQFGSALQIHGLELVVVVGGLGLLVLALEKGAGLVRYAVPAVALVILVVSFARSGIEADPTGWLAEAPKGPSELSWAEFSTMTRDEIRAASDKDASLVGVAALMAGERLARDEVHSAEESGFWWYFRPGEEVR